MTTTNVFNGVLWVRRTDVKFYYDGSIYFGKCSMADNLDRIVPDNFERCDSSAMPISIEENESTKVIEMTFRVSECGLDMGFTSILLKKKTGKYVKKSIQSSDPVATPILNQTTVVGDDGKSVYTIPNQCLDLVRKIAHYRSECDVQMLIIQQMLNENMWLRDIIQSNQLTMKPDPLHYLPTSKDLCQFP